MAPSPIGKSVDNVFVDPDAVVVYLNGKVATMGNVLIGGSADGGQTGQLMETTRAGQLREGEQVKVIEDPENAAFLCLRNINHLIFDQAGRLLVTNFNNRNANVCAITSSDPNDFIDLIHDVEGDGPAGITVQYLGTGGTAGDLFVTAENNMYRYNSDAQPQLPTLYAEQRSAFAYGPKGSPFEGLLIRHSGMLLVRPDVESDQETPLLEGSIGFIAFYPNDAVAKKSHRSHGVRGRRTSP